MERMRTTELRQIGIALNGGSEEGWQAGLARLLCQRVGGHYDRQRIHQWASEITPIPRLIGALLRAWTEVEMLKRSIDEQPRRGRKTTAVIAAACIASLVMVTGDGRAQDTTGLVNNPFYKIDEQKVEIRPLPELFDMLIGDKISGHCRLTVTMRVERGRLEGNAWVGTTPPGSAVVVGGTGMGPGATSVATSSANPQDAVFTTNKYGLITVGFDKNVPGAYGLTVGVTIDQHNQRPECTVYTLPTDLNKVIIGYVFNRPGHGQSQKGL